MAVPSRRCEISEWVDAIPSGCTGARKKRIYLCMHRGSHPKKRTLKTFFPSTVVRTITLRTFQFIFFSDRFAILSLRFLTLSVVLCPQNEAAVFFFCPKMGSKVRNYRLLYRTVVFFSRFLSVFRTTAAAAVRIYVAHTGTRFRRGFLARAEALRAPCCLVRWLNPFTAVLAQSRPGHKLLRI